MADIIMINSGNSAGPAGSAKALSEKYDRVMATMREQERRAQQAAQMVSSQPTTVKIDYESLHSAIEDIIPDSILPENYFENNEMYQKRSLELLEEIKNNTAVLNVLVELISQSNEKQDEVIALVTDILSIAKSATKEEADTWYNKAMKKITDAGAAVDASIKLFSLAGTTHTMVCSLLA